MARLADKRRELAAGGLMAAIGLGAIVEAQTYNVGSLTDMGPGFLPLALGCVLVLIGALIAAGLSVDRQADDSDPSHAPVGPFDWRGGSAIVLGVVAFIALGAYAGLIAAIFACVFIAALGDRSATLRGCLALAFAITVGGSVLFVYLLKVPFPLVRW